jgi:hypothetical protein
MQRTSSVQLEHQDEKGASLLTWRIAALLVAISALPTAGIAQGQVERGTEHPIVGKWQWTNKANACTEVYDFRSDGALLVQSGRERTDNTYSVAKLPDAGGFYALTSKVTRDYGGLDCADSESDSTGEEYTHFVLFEPSMEMFISCNKPNLEKCFGPLRRVTE